MDFMLLMHGDQATPDLPGQWDSYFEFLHADGAFLGGSSIGDGETFRKAVDPAPMAAHLAGFIRVRAASLEDARRFLAGNPVYENGGTVEIRELPED